MPSLAASVQAISPRPRNRSQGYPSISLRRNAVCYVMSYVNPEPSRRIVYLWSPAPVSVPPGYHKICGAVKGSKITPISWEYPEGQDIIGEVEVQVPAE